MAVKAGNISKGMFIMFKGAPHLVTKTEFMAPGKGSAVNRVRMKHVETGSVADFTYKTNEMVEEAEVDKKEMQYLYQDGTDFVFMDPKNYEQITVPGRLVEGKEGYLTPDLTVVVLVREEQPIGVKLPAHVVMKVTEAEDAVAGNRVNAPKKPIIVETGMQVMAPLFIKPGDKVMLDTDTGEYLSRVNE
jgi:elongation factor P